MQDFKNVSLSPVDVGGRVLAVGEIASLNGHAHVVHEAVSTGCLLAVTSEPAEPANASVGADKASEVADEAPDQSDEAPEKPARKSAARGSDKTKES